MGLAGAALLTITGAEALVAQAGPAMDSDDADSLQQEVYRLETAGRYAAAELLAERVLLLRRQRLGESHEYTLIALNNLASIYSRQSRHGEAEQLYRRMLELSARAYGPEARITLLAMTNLGGVYIEEYQYRLAEQLLTRALAIAERTQGTDSHDALGAATTLLRLYLFMDRFSEAEPLAVRLLETRRRTLGPDAPDSLLALNQLVTVYFGMGRLAAAEPLVRESLERNRRIRGAEHPATLTATSGLAGLLTEAGRLSEAEPLLRQVYEGQRSALGDRHQSTLSSAYDLAALRIRMNTPGLPALPITEQLLDGIRALRRGRSSDRFSQAQAFRDTRLTGPTFWLFADAYWQEERSRTRNRIVPEAVFVALQESITGAAPDAVISAARRRNAARTAAGLPADLDALATLEARWSALDAGISATYTVENGNGSERERLLREQRAVGTEIDRARDAIRRRYPQFSLALPAQALSVADAQRLLAADEAILLTVSTLNGTHMMAITRDRTAWQQTRWTLLQSLDAVDRLRFDLGARVERNPEVAAWERAEGGRFIYSRAVAFDLYRNVVQPVADLLQGTRRVYLVTDGPLQAIPFSALVTREPTGRDDDPAALRATAYFGDDHAIVKLPSIQALQLLRQHPSAAGNGQSYAGFGNPVLAGAASNRGRGDRGQRSLPFGSAADRSLADPGLLRSLSSLPGTALELEAARTLFGAPPDSVRMGEEATERAVRSADLSHVRVLHFATHAITAAEMSGVDLPGLVLTPPRVASEADDGYLSSNEISGLRLSADWVILSACNTATGLGNLLSDLSVAFLSAGARSLLASLWPVSDEVAPILIRRTLELERMGNPRAEAFQQAMREVRMNASHDSEATWAHPFFWAPFQMIGDGG